jgi:BirA family biotin operon repressor/biotin-[acetyl-CoA-carboxylase] ligase
MRGYSSEAVSGTSALSPEAVTPLLEGRFGIPYLFREVCESTQELVRGLPEGAVAATDNQTAGRGRRGRHWVSEPGTGVLFSLSLWPATSAERLAPFSLVLAEALCEALDEHAMVRWPNDVLVDGRKLAGVLPEVRDGQLIAGIGINADATAGELPVDARVPPTSLRVLRGGPVDRAAVLAAVLLTVERRYDAFERDGFTGLVRDELAGRTVRLAGGGEGTVDGIDADGRLVVGGIPHASAEVERVDVSPRRSTT